MRMHVIITQESNVVCKRVDNYDLISCRNYDWEKEVEILDTTAANVEEARKIVKVKDISIFDHRLVFDGDVYRILKCWSK